MSDYTPEQKAGAWLAAESMAGNEFAHTALNMLANTQQGEAVGEVVQKLNHDETVSEVVEWADGFQPPLGTKLYTHQPADKEHACKFESAIDLKTKDGWQECRECGKKMKHGLTYHPPADTNTVRVPESNNIKFVDRSSDFSVKVNFTSCRAATVFEKFIAAAQEEG